MAADLGGGAGAAGLRALVTLITGEPVGSLVLVSERQEADGNRMIVYRLPARRSFLLATPHDGGWMLTESLPGGNEGRVWSTVDDADDPTVALRTLESLFGQIQPGFEARFFATTDFADSVSSYTDFQQKVFLTSLGPVALHLRRTPEGRLTCIEFAEARGPRFFSFFYRFGESGPQAASGRFEPAPPDWVQPLSSDGTFDRLLDAFYPAAVGTKDREPASAAAAVHSSDIGALPDRVLGVFAAHAAVPLIRLAYAPAAAAFETHAQVERGEDGRFRRWSFRPGSGATLDEIQPLLTAEHERQHYQQLMTTPSGLYLWRLMNALTASLEFSLHVIETEAGIRPDRLPVFDWYARTGRAALAASRVPAGRRTKVDNVLRDAQAMAAFFTLFSGRSRHSVGDFLELADAAHREVCRASDLPVRASWTSRRDRQDPVLPDGIFSMTELVEAAARFKELLLLRGGDESVQTGPLETEWRGRALHGVYRPAFEALEAHLIRPSLAMLVIDLAMLGAADPVTHAEGDSISFEDVHPGWRLHRLLAAMDAQAFPDPLDDPGGWSLKRELAAAAGLPDPEAMLRAAVDRPFLGPHTWGADARIRGEDESRSAAAYYRRSASKTRHAFELRLADAALVSGRTGQTHFFHPPFEVWQDHVMISGFDPFFQGEDDPLGLHMAAMTFAVLCANTAALALLGNGDVSRLTWVAEGFSRWVESTVPERHRAQVRAVFDPRPGVRHAVKSGYAELLRW